MGATLDDKGDHVYFYLDYEGCEYTVGKLSHSWKGTLNNTQVMMMAHKLNLKKREFEQFVECDLSTAEMLILWQKRRQALS